MKEPIQLPEIRIVGITAGSTEVVSARQDYINNNLAKKITNNANPGKIYTVYTNYDKPKNSNYTCLIGEEVSAFTSLTAFETITIPTQHYLKFTAKDNESFTTFTSTAWQKTSQLNVERTYIADFEILDNNKLDIYIGVRQFNLWVEDTNLEPLLRAFTKLERFMLNDSTEQQRAGIIQAFEYCFELTWKTMKRILKIRGKIVNSPRESFREAALENLIDDIDLWFEFLRKRNTTVHTYNELEANQVITICPSFASEVRKFINKLKINND